MSTKEWAIATHGLRKTYAGVRRRTAVDGLDLQVPLGGVHGFLGPNGSGKTTTIRMLLGLARADAGSMEIFGHPVPKQLPQVVSRVGAIVESPKFFASFTGRHNLELLAAAIGTPTAQVQEVLTQTGLRERADDRFGRYSLGMKQRLAIAATLLKKPELLIFDEPTNGLDPAGIHEVRATMRSLADEGRTVLVSSHILAEVEQIADTVSIIGRGRLIASGAVTEIIGERAGSVRVGVGDADRAAHVLTGVGLQVRREHGHLVVEGQEDPAAVNRILADQGLYAHELVRQRPGLEAAFLELTEGVELGRTKRRDRLRGIQSDEGRHR